MDPFQHLLVDIADSGVATIRLNRPPANAVNRDMYIELKALFSDPDRMGANVRAIVLAADGKHFCAGNDLDEFMTMTPDNGAERMWRVREAFFAIQYCPVPIVGAVQGAALGTGLAIAASCDFIVAADEARFGLPELTVGVMGGARHLARIAPEPLVRRMFFTGAHLTAAEFAAAGASISVCRKEDLLGRARELAQRIASFSPTAVRLSKHVLDRVEDMDLRAGYEYEQGFTVRMSGHPDSKEALRAFQERRPPKYETFAGGVI